MLNFHNLSDAAYKNLRYRVLVSVEETGNPKSTAYLDSKQQQGTDHSFFRLKRLCLYWCSYPKRETVVCLLLLH